MSDSEKSLYKKATELTEMNDKDVANYDQKKSDRIKGPFNIFWKKKMEEEDEEYEMGIKRIRRRIIKTADCVNHVTTCRTDALTNPPSI